MKHKRYSVFYGKDEADVRNKWEKLFKGSHRVLVKIHKDKI